MRSLARVVCCCALLLGSACTAPGAAVAPTPSVPAMPDTQAVSPMTLSAGTSPLTGLPLAEGKSATLRPVGIVLDNVRVALPQRGIGDARIVYEVVAESGITRLLALYEDYTALPEVGPVRSARDVHVQLAIGTGAMLLHVGGSTPATDLLEIYHYGDRSINGYYETGALELDTDRNATVAIEHCWFTGGTLFASAARAYNLSTELDAPQPAFQFVPAGTAPRTLSNEGADTVTIRFSSYDTTVLTYRPATAQDDAKAQSKAADSAKARAASGTASDGTSSTPSPAHTAGIGVYEKTQFGAPQVDENTGQTLAFTNVLVLFAATEKYPDGVLAKIDMTGGSGWYFSGGRGESVRWEKGLPEQPLRILTQDGTQYAQINPGTTYVAVVDLNKEKYFTVEAQQ